MFERSINYIAARLLGLVYPKLEPHTKERTWEVINADRVNLWKHLESNYIQQGEVGLDIGAGDGSFGTLSRNSQVFSIDSSRHAKMTSNYMSIGGAEALPFADSIFDFVLIMYALHHFEAQKEAIDEAVRVLRSGGHLVIREEFLRYPWQMPWVLANEQLGNNKLYGESSAIYSRQVRYFSRMQLLHDLESRRMQIIEETYRTNPDFYRMIYKTRKVLLVAKKID